jgi:hypothetical protein
VLLVKLYLSWQLASADTKPDARDTGVMQRIIVEDSHRAGPLPPSVDPNPHCNPVATKPDPIMVISIPPDNGPRDGMIAFKTGHWSPSDDELWPSAGLMDSKTAGTPDTEEQPNTLMQTETERFP